METLFLDAANKVLNMYDRRQASAKYSPANSESEIQWGSEVLSTLAGVAAYAGFSSAVAIRAAAQEWNRTGHRPLNFVSLEDSKL